MDGAAWGWSPVSPCRAEDPTGGTSPIDIFIPRDARHCPLLGLAHLLVVLWREMLSLLQAVCCSPSFLSQCQGTSLLQNSDSGGGRKRGQIDRCLDQHQSHLFRNTLVVFEICIFTTLTFTKTVYFYVCELWPSCLCVPCMCIAYKSQKMASMSQNWNYEQLWAAMWVPRTEFRSSTRVASALNHWVIPLVPWFCECHWKKKTQTHKTPPALTGSVRVKSSCLWLYWKSEKSDKKHPASNDTEVDVHLPICTTAHQGLTANHSSGPQMQALT